jgi:hypothetical protein
MSTEHAVRAARTRSSRTVVQQPSGVTWWRSVVAQCMRRVASREEERMRGTKAPTVAVTTATSVVPGIAGQCPPCQRGAVNAATGTECAPVPEPAQDQPTWCSTDCVPEFEQLGHLFICDCMHQCTQRVNLYTSVTACVSCTVLFIHQHTHTHPSVRGPSRSGARTPASDVHNAPPGSPSHRSALECPRGVECLYERDALWQWRAPEVDHRPSAARAECVYERDALCAPSNVRSVYRAGVCGGAHRRDAQRAAAQPPRGRR